MRKRSILAPARPAKRQTQPNADAPDYSFDAVHAPEDLTAGVSGKPRKMGGRSKDRRPRDGATVAGGARSSRLPPRTQAFKGLDLPQPEAAPPAGPVSPVTN